MMPHQRDKDGDVGEIHRDLNRKLAVASSAFALGFFIMMLGVAAYDSRRVLGFALAWLTGVVMYGRLQFRCPLCLAAVFDAPALKAIGWILRPPRRCPRCRTEFADAKQTLHSTT